MVSEAGKSYARRDLAINIGVQWLATSVLYGLVMPAILSLGANFEVELLNPGNWLYAILVSALVTFTPLLFSLIVRSAAIGRITLSTGWQELAVSITLPVLFGIPSWFVFRLLDDVPHGYTFHSLALYILALFLGCLIGSVFASRSR